MLEGDQPQGLTKAEIDQLIVGNMKEKDVGISECAICSSDNQRDESVIRLPCRHAYHADCLVPWLQMKSVCPTCKLDLRGKK